MFRTGLDAPELSGLRPPPKWLAWGTAPLVGGAAAELQAPTRRRFVRYSLFSSILPHDQSPLAPSERPIAAVRWFHLHLSHGRRETVIPSRR